MHVTSTNGSEPLEDAIRNVNISLRPSNAVRMVLSHLTFILIRLQLVQGLSSQNEMTFL